MPVLEIKNITKTYKKGEVRALDDFSVTLTPGVTACSVLTEQAKVRL